MCARWVGTAVLVAAVSECLLLAESVDPLATVEHGEACECCFLPVALLTQGEGCNL